MKRTLGFVIGLVLVLMVLFNWHSSSQAEQGSPATLSSDPANSSIRTTASPSDQTQAAAQTENDYGKLPMTFELNEGQTDSAVKFLSHAHGQVLFFTPNEAVLVLPSGKIARTRKSDISTAEGLGKSERKRAEGAVLRIKLMNANERAHMIGKHLPMIGSFHISVNNGDALTNWRIANHSPKVWMR